MTDTQKESSSGPTPTLTTEQNVKDKENANSSSNTNESLPNTERPPVLSERNVNRAQSPFKVRGRRPSKDCEPMPPIEELE